MISKISDRVYRLTYLVDFPGVPPVNVYAILDSEPILIDCGPDGPIEPLLSELASIGVTEVRHLVITHGHVDHFGLARRLLERWPLRVYIHRDDVAKCTMRDEERPALATELKDIIRAWGVPEPMLAGIEGRILEVMRLGPPLDRTRVTPITEGPLRLGRTEVYVHHFPGHTEGLICVSMGTMLFSSDHLLEDITPNPSLYLPRYRGWRSGLKHYIASLKRVGTADLVLPGHGSPYADPRQRAARIEQAYRERRQNIMNMLDGKSLNVMQLTKRLWSDLNPINFFLGGREVHGHLEILEEEGLVQNRDGLFSRVNP